MRSFYNRLFGGHHWPGANVTAYGLPGTDSQRAQNLLKQDFKTPERRRRRGRMSCLERDDRLAGGARSDHADACTGKALPHVAAAVSPYSPRGLGQVSANRMTAFAKVNYDRQAASSALWVRSQLRLRLADCGRSDRERARGRVQARRGATAGHDPVVRGAGCRDRRPALLWRRRFPFAAPAAVWLLAATLSSVDGRLIGRSPC